MTKPECRINDECPNDEGTRAARRRGSPSALDSSYALYFTLRLGRAGAVDAVAVGSVSLAVMSFRTRSAASPRKVWLRGRSKTTWTSPLSARSIQVALSRFIFGLPAITHAAIGAP